MIVQEVVVLGESKPSLGQFQDLKPSRTEVWLCIWGICRIPMEYPVFRMCIALPGLGLPFYKNSQSDIFS